MTKPITNIADLKHDRSNPRKHNPRNLQVIVDSLQNVGFARSIVIDENNEILAGNGVTEAAAIAGMERVVEVEADGNTIIAVRRRGLTDEQKQRLKYFDNRSGELAEWDAEQLLADLNAGVDLSAMFKDDELDALLAELQDAPQELADVAPQVDRAAELQAKWGTATGQLWQLGEHRIICGDCTDEAIVKRLLSDEQPNLIIADPPYGVSIVATNVSVGGGEGPNGMIPFGGVRKRKGHVGGGESIKASPGLYPIQMKDKSKRLGSVGGAKPFGSAPVRGSDGASNIVDVGKYAPIIGDETTETALRSSAFYLSAYPKAVQVWWGANYYVDGLTPSACWLVWDKETTGNFADCELAWTNQDKAAKLFRHQWNGMLRDSERERRWHPTQKPAALAAWVFTEFTEPGAIVVDPFAGAGWAVLGGEQAQRKVRAIEMSEEYIAIILDRWATATGKTPVRVG